MTVEPGDTTGAVSLRDLGAEQVAALFANVAVGVVAAAFSAALLSGLLAAYGLVSGAKAAQWSAYIALCAGAHLALRRAYLRSDTRDRHWRRWGNLFATIAFAEGLGWGWATILLVDSGRFDVEMMVVVVCLAIAIGSITAFGSYLPALFAIFVPTTTAYLIWNVTSSEPLVRTSELLMLLFIPSFAILGFLANRTFKEVVGLRLSTARLAESLRRQKEIAEAANLAKSTFLAAASHDLRQPIHALGLFIGALRARRMDDEAHRLLDHIGESVGAMDELFASLLDISKLDAGVVQPSLEVVAVGPILRRLCREHSSEASAKGVQLRLVECSCAVTSDPLLLERILRNILANAVRYTDGGHVLVGCRRTADSLLIEVRDTGVGIADDKRERIFEEFFQVGNPERDRSQGLGLGLAIVKRMTPLIGADLVVASAIGRGSAFGLRLPRTRARSVAVDPAQPAPSPFHRALVLVIDDEAAIQLATSTLLTSWGHRVIAAGSAAEMIERIVDCPERPGLIICDYRLRGAETGIQVVRRLRGEYNHDIPAILITGDTAPDRLVEAQASGLALLHKPLSNAKLRAAVGNLIRDPSDSKAGSAPTSPDAPPGPD